FSRKISYLITIYSIPMNLIEISYKKMYNEECRARWGGSGALSLAIRYSKTEFPLEVDDFMVCLKELVLTFRSCATGTHEPCQVRKEAAVSGHSCVPWGSLDRAMNLSNA